MISRIEWAMNLARDENWLALLAEQRQAEIDRITSSHVEDIETREDAYRRVKLYDELKAHIDSLAATKSIKEKRWKVL